MSTMPTNVSDDLQHRKTEAQHISPTLIIGLGGSGGDVLLRIRKKFFEKFGSIEEFPIVAYLWFDTDKNYKDVGAKQFARKVDFQNTEERLLTMSDTASITQHLDQPVYSHIAKWWPAGLNIIPRLDDGAGQYRPYSRLGMFYHYSAAHGSISVRDAITLALRKIAHPDARKRVENSPQLQRLGYAAEIDFSKKNVYLIGSLAGGTGSGIFLDIARMVRLLDSQAILAGFFMTSRIFPNAKPRMHANTYAALLEWDYYNEHRFPAQWSVQEAPVPVDAPVFNYAYILDTPNFSNVDLGAGADDHKKIYETIAENVFKDFSHGPFAQAKRSARVNLGQFMGNKTVYPPLPPSGTVLSEEEQRRFRQSFNRHYQSFGMASITVPHDRIITACAHKLAADLVQFWRGEGTGNTAGISQDIEHFTRSASLTTVALLQRLDDAGARGELASPSGTLLIKTVRIAETSFDEARGLPVTDRADAIDATVQKFRSEQLAPGGRGQSSGLMIRTIEDNGTFVLEGLTKAIKEACDTRIDVEKQSVLSTIKYVERVGEVLESMRKQYEDRATALREAVAEREAEYNGRINDLRNHSTRHNLDFRKQIIIDYDELLLKEATVGAGTRAQEMEEQPGLLLLLRQLALCEKAVETCQKLLNAVLGAKDEKGFFRGGTVSRLRELDRTFTVVAEALLGDAGYFAKKHNEDLSLVLFDEAELESKYYKHVLENKKDQILQELSNDVRDKLHLTAASISDTNFLKQEGGSGKILDLCRGYFECIRNDFHVIDVLYDRFGSGEGRDGEPLVNERMAAELRRVYSSACYWAQGGSDATRNYTLEPGQQEFHVGLPTVPSDLPPETKLPLQRRRERIKAFLQDSVNQAFDFPDIPDTSEIIFYTDLSGIPLNFFTSMGNLRTVYRDLLATDPSLHLESREASKFEDVLILTPEETARLRAAYRCFVRCAMFDEIWVEGTSVDRSEYGYTQTENGVESNPRLGDLRGTILRLQTREDVLRSLDQRHVMHLAEIGRGIRSTEAGLARRARSTATWIAAILAGRMEELANSADSHDWHQLAMHPKMEYLALDDFNREVRGLAGLVASDAEYNTAKSEVKEGTARFARKRTDGRWVLNLAAVQRDSVA